MNKKMRSHRPLPKTLTINEMNLLLDAPNHYTIKGTRDRAILELLYATGIRVSELVNLKLSNLDIDECSIRVFGKGGKERMVPIVKSAMVYLKDYIAMARPLAITPWLFPGETAGRPITRQTIWRMIKNYAKTVGIELDVGPHTLRHSYATHLYSNRVDIPKIQKLLGHSRIDTTMIYAHISDPDLVKAVNECHPRGNNGN